MKPFLRTQLERFARRLQELDFLLSRGLAQKMLHGTLAELRAGDAETREQTARTASRLFLRSQSKNSL